MKRFIIISTLIIFAGLSILCLVLKQNSSLAENAAIDQINFCGTQAFYEENHAEGKKIFNTNCAACHRLDRKMIGPALRNIATTYDSMNLSNYIRGKKHTIEDKGYGLDCIIFPQLSDEDIMDLLSYTN